ncbi:MAG TPA: non-homologous end-joining DNA ligase, partial [Kofleriaceae bacterium]|nr:non-homologous end-joining DNA ligase [Kofleriaceae bacterium]
MASSPGGAAASGRARMFVVHQHDATRMHWDLRLEIDGVLCSWAVPKPPSLDPDDKRLAVKVENHPLEYVHFEAVIPDGNYGAGPMICWDRGCFRPLIDPAQGLVDGEIKFELYGYKLRGAFTLVHTGKGKRGRGSGRGSNDWLLIKKRDEHATSEPLDGTSVLTGLSIDERATWPRHKAVLEALAHVPKKPVANVEPMLCQTADAPFSSDEWVYELKYDGFRLVSYGGAGHAQLRYRSGLDSTDRFPEIASAIRALPVEVVLDGEVVVLDAEGKPDFHKLAARAQITKASEIQRAALTAPVTYVVFDLLAIGGHDLRALPLLERKAVLAAILPKLGPLKYSEHIAAQGEALLAAVVARGLEGVVAKKANSPYVAGRRSKDWLKLKRDPEADFAICGYTPPKGGRVGIGALHLCVRDGDTWRYAGKVGSGFDDKELAVLAKELAAKPAW